MLAYYVLPGTFVSTKGYDFKPACHQDALLQGNFFHLLSYKLCIQKSILCVSQGERGIPDRQKYLKAYLGRICRESPLD